MVIVRFAAAALLCLGVGVAACGGDDDEPEQSALESACIDFCDASVGTCPIKGITVEQCRQGCGYAEVQLGGYCVAEYTAVFQCGAKGGFTCSENGPLPKDPCLEVNEKWMSCTLNASCSKFCAAAGDAGCPPGGSSTACVQQCQATRAEIGVCETQYGLYLQCAEAFGLTCDGSVVRSEACDDELPDVGRCVAQNGDACAGYCFASSALGCAEAGACEKACAAERDANAACEESYATWLTCILDDFAPACEGGKLAASSCSSQRQAYDTCITSM